MTKAALSFVALTLIVAPTRGEPTQPTFLGVVDAHGRLTPIGVYDGMTWWNRWPWGRNVRTSAARRCRRR